MSVSIHDIGGQRPLRALVVEATPNSSSPVLLFLHGKGEASRFVNEIPKVFFHLSPPFRAATGELLGVTVVAPQAPNDPEDGWNWRDYVPAIGAWMRSSFAGRRVLASGFSRGGLGVLQLIRAHPDLVSRWALVDPQKADDAKEQRAVTPTASSAANGWLRFGPQLAKNTPFSKHLAGVLPPENGRYLDMGHVDLAKEAFAGSVLGGPVDLYGFLGVSFSRGPGA